MDIRYEWPEGVPETYDELAREYGTFVADRVGRYNKVNRNLDDLIQYIWMQLIAGKVLEKYVDRARSTLPPTLTAVEVAKYLGLTIEVFLDAQARYHKKKGSRRKAPPWMPTPLEDGDPLSEQSVYLAQDVEALNEMMDQPRNNVGKRTAEQVMPFVGAHGFRAYLTQAIHNHYANWCRTRSRKWKDVLLSPNSIIGETSPGVFKHRGYSEDGTSWESALVSASMDAETTVQCREFVDRSLAGTGHGDSLGVIAARSNIDMSRVDDWEEYVDDEGYRRQRPTAEAKRCLMVLDYVAEGYTAREAVKCTVRAEAREKQRVQARLA